MNDFSSGTPGEPGSCPEGGPGDSSTIAGELGVVDTETLGPALLELLVPVLFGNVEEVGVGAGVCAET